MLNGLNRRENLDIYVTGSNSKFLSTDVLTEFRGCGDNCMAALVNILASAVGSLTNPLKLANTFGSNGMHVSDKTIGIYIGYLLDAFFISKSQRYDIKGKRYIASPFKHYFTDMRLRNAQLNFRQQEENHIMENIIYNELLIRGFNVDVGGVDHSERNDNGKAVRNKHNTPITQTTNKPKSSNNPTKTQIIFFTKSPHHSPPQDAPEKPAALLSGASVRPQNKNQNFSKLLKTPPNHFRYNNEQIITCQKTKPKHQKRRGGGCDQSRRTTGRVNRPIPKSNIFHLLQNNRRLFHRRRSRPGNLPVRIRKIHLLRRQKRKILDLQNRYQQSLRLSQAFRPKANPLRRPIFHKSGGPGPDPRRSLPGRRSKGRAVPNLQVPKAALR